jgi:hypothetical protein
MFESWVCRHDPFEYEYRFTEYECDLPDELVSIRISLMPMDRGRSASPTRIGFKFQMDIRLS